MAHEFPVRPDDLGRLPIAPTDVSQFIRLDQCERYLRLRLHERSADRNFMRAHGVAPQAMPPLLTREGAAFEQRITRAIAAQVASLNLAEQSETPASRPPDNARVLDAARSLAAGGVLVLFQPRLEAALGGWLVRGDVDVLRLERDPAGTLRALVADVKSSASSKIEHRLQVAFYREMVLALFREHNLPCAGVDVAILYRGPAAGGGGTDKLSEAEERAQREAAGRVFGVGDALLDVIGDPESYARSVRDLVTGPRSVARRAAEAPFDRVGFHLTYRCDGCMYNELCMQWSAERDDLSLVPHLAVNEKSALVRAGVTSVAQLAALKEPRRGDGSESSSAQGELVPASGSEELVRRLSTTWPIGPRLDELVYRARRATRFRGVPEGAPTNIPSKGYGSLPFCDAHHNPNLVRVYVDAQHDYVEQRIYMLGALVSACDGGREDPKRRRSIVHVTAAPPRTAQQEQQLFVRWVGDTIRAVVELAAPDEHGQPRAPVHLIFYDRYEQRILLDGLARHFAAAVGATPLYDFVTQLAAYDSPVVTFLDQEIRELKNYPMVCQSLQAVAAFLGFDWNAGRPYRELFRERLFDFWRKRDAGAGAEGGQNLWYMGRSRFSSQIPLEYAYAAWKELPERPGDAEARRALAPYRQATIELLRGFQARRLEAMEHVARDFRGNQQTTKTPFALPDLAQFAETPPSLARALDEFVSVERHVALGAWKAARLAPPERRVLSGDTLLVEYREEDQEPDVAARNREHARRERLRERYEEEYRAAHPGEERPALTPAHKAATQWSCDGFAVRLRLSCAGLDCEVDEVLALTTLREGDRVVVAPRTSVDSRLPRDQQVAFTPTPKQLLYAARADVERITVERDSAGKAVACLLHVRMTGNFASNDRGFAFRTIRPLAFTPGLTYTVDEDPNDWYGSWCAQVTEGLCELEAGKRAGFNALYDRLADPASARTSWPPAAVEGQHRFLEGLDAFRGRGIPHGFEESKRAYVGGHGDAPTLLVQGPPGTGKSYTTAFALYARMQGAMAAGVPYRVVVSCKTHAATDVLLENMVRVGELLRDLRRAHPDELGDWFDARLLDVPLFRLDPREGSVEHLPGVAALSSRRLKGVPPATRAIEREPWCVLAATPGAVFRLVRDRWGKDLFGHELIDCLVLDEASQMNLPEAVMAALPLARHGHLIVVGDPRQMPPIVQHNWSAERRRTFQAFRTYESLFTTLREIREPAPLPLIQFAESFRLHRDVAEFLRQEIYRHDGIPYFSRRVAALPPREAADPFVRAVLDPAHPITVVVHDEASSQVRNPFERDLIAPVLRILTAEDGYRLDPREGIGVVVPHRAQRAALKEAVPSLTVVDERTGADVASAVDTVERFQGREREVIAVSATESDRDYLLVSSEFLLDPRRLTVALSRAKHKMILVAARSVFDVFSPDEETFAHAQLWKNLLHRTCTVPLWSGERHGVRVEVWGNDAARGSNLADFLAASPLRGTLLQIERTADGPHALNL